MPALVETTYTPLGGSAELFRCRAPEALTEGPANTGKSRAWAEYVNWFCHEYPGTRALVLRKTRKSLSESWMVTFENQVLGHDHPLITSGPSRSHRDRYTYENGSEIVLGGMDNPTRIFSAEFDLIYVQEATELTEAEWESLHRALRWKRAPYQQLGGDCNPDAPNHWLNLRCNAGRCARIITRHADNPTVTAKDIERLAGLTGVRRLRLYEGKWAAAEGMIFESWDPAVHLVDASAVPSDPKTGAPLLRWYVGSIDWGWRNPGCMQVWGIDYDGVMYRLLEVYRVEQTRDWWADQAERAMKRWPISRFAADPEDPEGIDRLRRRGLPVSEAKKAVETGLDAVRERLRPHAGGRPRLFMLRDALDCRDATLHDTRKPCCTEEEVWSYCYELTKEGRPIKERPDPTCADHGCDAMRYAVMEVDRRDDAPGLPPPRPPHQTWDDITGDTEFLEGLRNG